MVAEGALPVRGDGDWFAWEWDCAKELKADDHIIPLVVGDPCDAATLDAFTGTVNRYPMDAGAKFERDVDDVIKRCDSLKEKIEKLARRGEAARTKAEKKFRTRSEKRLRKMSSMGITLYDPKCKCVRDELVADAQQRGLTQLQAKDVLEEIDKALDDEKNRRRWFAAHPWTVRLFFLLIVILFAWCAYELLSPEQRACVDEFVRVTVRGLTWLWDKVVYICDGTVKELSRSLR